MINDYFCILVSKIKIGEILTIKMLSEDVVLLVGKFYQPHFGGVLVSLN